MIDTEVPQAPKISFPNLVSWDIGSWGILLAAGMTSNKIQHGKVEDGDQLPF